MDPQKNSMSPAPNDGQQPQPLQQPTQEVTVDFNQDAQNTADASTSPSSAFSGDMPSITSDAAASNPAAAPSYDVPQQPMSNDPLAYGPGGTAGGSGQPQSPSFADQQYSQPQAPIPPVQSTPDPYAAPSQAPGQPQPQPGGFPPQQPDQAAYASPGVTSVPSQSQPGQMGQQPYANQPQPGQPQPNGSMVPPTAPVPVAAPDKKTIFILAGVAVVLVVAIAVLFLM